MATNLNAQDQGFVHAYSKLLVEAWTDPSFRSLLQADPTAAAKNAGLNPKAGGTVTIEDKSGNADINAQVQAWREGDESGNYTLYVPDEPQLGVQSGAGAVGDDSYCCCCCPCCTCT
jgi:hypothetical protein